VIRGDLWNEATCQRTTALEASEELRLAPEHWNRRTDARRDHPSHRARVIRDARRLLDGWSRARGE